MKWHYIEQGQQLGPVTDDQLLELDRNGTISAETLVWHEGMADWKPCRDVRGELKGAGPSTIFVAAASTPNPEGATAGQPTAAAGVPPIAGAGPEAICAECGKIFPIDEMIRHGNVRICSNCKPVFMQKLSEGASLNTGELKYAGFGIRFAAKFLDGLILGVPMVIVFVILMFALVPQSFNPQTHGQMSPVQSLIIAGLEFGMVFVQMAYVVFFTGKYGATPGKMICKLKIVTAEGDKISYPRAVGRFFSEMLSGMVCYIGYFLVLFDQEKRALHDHICKTRVVYK